MKSFQNGSADPRLLGDPGGPLERAVDAEQRALLVDEREEARRRADDGAAEVALALEHARLARPLGEVADDEHELVGPARDDAALVVALLAREARSSTRCAGASCSATARLPAASTASATSGGSRSWTLRPMTSSADVRRSSSESTLNPR